MSENEQTYRIVSISASNYYNNDITKLTGSAKIVHTGTSMEFQIKLTPEDCVAIFGIISDRVGEIFNDVAMRARDDIEQNRNKMLQQAMQKKLDVAAEVDDEDPF